MKILIIMAMAMAMAMILVNCSTSTIKRSQQEVRIYEGLLQEESDNFVQIPGSIDYWRFIIPKKPRDRLEVYIGRDGLLRRPTHLFIKTLEPDSVSIDILNDQIKNDTNYFIIVTPWGME